MSARRSAGREQNGAGAAAALDLHEAPAQPARSAAAGTPKATTTTNKITRRRPTNPQYFRGRRSWRRLVTLLRMSHPSTPRARRLTALAVALLAVCAPLFVSTPAPAAASDQD